MTNATPRPECPEWRKRQRERAARRKAEMRAAMRKRTRRKGARRDVPTTDLGAFFLRTFIANEKRRRESESTKGRK